MKRVWVAITLFVIALAISIAGLCTVTVVTDTMKRGVESVIERIDADDFSSAQQQGAQLQAYWGKSSQFLCVFLNHSQLGEVDASLSALEMHLRYQDTAWSMVNCNDLKEKLEKLKKTEVPFLENIL